VENEFPYVHVCKTVAANPAMGAPKTKRVKCLAFESLAATIASVVLTGSVIAVRGNRELGFVYNGSYEKLCSCGRYSDVDGV
jgi:hypothetical protein